ncbi:DUF2750 domain-containing protein [Geodermatophilus ruber]|uniref:DUF2750 domain-containing protein n=1 Tax=Geodermatophilus ruber TaxID=504800 RepID=A0A1I4B0E7_9ACTN|nr:DUF2750 domain-containing protein [Geodermatophilus ruber]SFK61326.1 Protein of unknown function [Geodermatophilus ruber]
MPDDPIAAMWAAARAQGGLWGWGDADGIVPWTDDSGRIVVPLWTDGRRAEAEAGAGADPGEAPVLLDLEDLLAEIPLWLAAGVSAAGLQSDGGRFLLTLSLPELTEALLRLQVNGGPGDPA